MTSGGARARSGSPPDPQAARRERDSGQWTTLPAEGRTAPAPEWPLLDPSPRELELWEHLWSRPQALLWERSGQEVEVALLCRRLAEVEAPKASASLGTLVRQMMDSLLLTIPSMRAARVQIADGGEAEAAMQPPARQRRSSARSRLTVVRDDGDEGA